MTDNKPPTTATSHPLPFDRLSPRDFERLCLWLVQREGYENPQHVGAAGSEQGRDIIAGREGQQWAFQCKRVQNFGPKDAVKEVEKVLTLPEDQRPAGLMFLVTCDVSAETRQSARERCGKTMECLFWAGTELDEKVRRYPDIVREFFQVPQPFAPTWATAPSPPAHFVGRQTNLDALGQALMAGNVPQAITGMGGIGKTALAQQLARRMADDFPGGVFWADLPADEGNPMPILAVWARLCGQDVNALPADTQGCVVVVRGFLAERVKKQGRLLIVIDDVREKWLDGARALSESRPPCVPLLLTTRDNVSAINLGANVCALSALPLADAVTLLSQLAGDVIEREQEHARRLATLVDCLPLALELAGKLAALRARKPDWRLADLCERIESGRADENLRLGEQPGLAATFLVSYQDLDADQQRLFRVLGAFAPVPMAAEGVTIALGGDSKTAGATEDGLDKLVDLSLVRWLEGTGIAGTYYTMHPLVYEFAAGLTSLEERKGFRTPVLNVLRGAMCSEQRPEVERRDAAYTLTRLRWLDDAANVSADDVSAYMELVGRYLDSPAERRRLVQVITSMLDVQPTRLSELQQIRLMLYRAINLGYLGEVGEAESDYEQAIRLIGSRADLPEYQKVLARVNLGIGNILSSRADVLAESECQEQQRELLQRAVDSYLKAAEAARTYGQDVILETGIYKELGYTYALLQDWTEAERYCHKALDVLQQTKDAKVYVIYHAQILDVATNVHLEKGQSLASPHDAQALSEYETAYELARKAIAMLGKSLGESEELVIARIHAGECLLAMSECPGCREPEPLATACADWRIALDMARRLGIGNLEQEADKLIGLYCR